MTSIHGRYWYTASRNNDGRGYTFSDLAQLVRENRGNHIFFDGKDDQTGQRVWGIVLCGRAIIERVNK